MGLFKPKLRADIQEKLNRPGVRAFISVPCVEGLPVPERVLSQIYCFDDRIEIVSNGVEYLLRMEKIQSVTTQMNGYLLLIISYVDKYDELTYVSFDVSHTPKVKEVVRHFENVKKDSGTGCPVEL